MGPVDLLRRTIGATRARAIIDRLGPRWVVPVHYRTHRIGFLETHDAFLEVSPAVEHIASPVVKTEKLAPASIR